MKTAAKDLHTTTGNDQPLTVHLVSHNHWDREWIFTARYTNRWLIGFFDNLLRTLADQPDYRFVLDGQTLIVEDYLAQLSAEEAARQEKELRKHVGEGRLLVGPAYLQPDWTLVTGEALVRNLMIGHRIAGELGGVMKAGWMLDNFGQIAQAPQILRGFGIDGVFVWRGVAMEDDELKSEFLWESPDGSSVLAIYLINSYRNAMVLSLTREIAVERILTEVRALRPFATTPNVLLMNGYEQVPWPDDVLPIIEEFNSSVDENITCRQSTPSEYIDAIRRANPQLPTLRGYLYSGKYMPVLKGVFSSRNHLKLLNNECQRELERWAEPFATVAWLLGVDYPKARLEKAWKTLLLNHAHDDMCGCSVDPIARDMEARFEEVFRIATDVADESLRTIASSVDASRFDSLLSIIVFNPSPRERSDVIGFSLEVPHGAESFSFKDSGGKTAPIQVRKKDGNRIDLYLLAESVPELGYKTYYLVPLDEPRESCPAVTASAEERTLENEFLKVRINDDGSMMVTHKQSGRAYDNLGCFEDGGDAGDTYDYSYPERDTIFTSKGRQAQITMVEPGPLMAKFRVEITLDLPEQLAPDRKARSSDTRTLHIISYVELTPGARRVEIKTILKNVAKDHRLRVLFPTGLGAAHCFAEEPFDVARLPIAEEPSPERLSERFRELMLAGRYTRPVNTHPFQNFVDYNDGERGMAIISRRVTEFEILPDNGTIALTLLRSVGWLARSDLLTRVGDVGPHIFTPEAQCLGEHVFHYAVFPHSGDWPEEKAHVQAFSHNLKLRAVLKTDPGSLPDQMSFFSLASEDPAGAFRLSALKRAEDGDGVIVRVFNTTERSVRGRLESYWPADLALRTNLNEEERDEANIVDGAVEFEARQKEILTLKLKVSPRLQLDAQHSDVNRVLPPLPPGEKKAEGELPPVVTREEVQAERDRAARLEAELIKAKAAVFTVEDDIERTASKNILKMVELQKAKTEVASLTRQLNESRISALLNRQLYITKKMEDELEEIGEAVSWSRTRKRAGEYLVHYYEGLLRKKPKAD
ncbi:MAG TPA: glycoside hydrolase family 38 C-terminal domain-containing protein [Blastocatellia bacterium]|nr:glycoside hydrolase family 38 C-terminal domain-containing protein [Blastocatellia bacterium]